MQQQASNTNSARRSNRTNNLNNNHIINTSCAVELVIGISCTVFDSYQDIPLTLSPSFVREVLNMESAEAGMKHLSRHVCTHAICTIYEDLANKNDQEKIRQLLKKVQLFHIHGRTAHDIIFPSHDDDDHAHHGRRIYVCTHC
jgi:hypothetical protein